jgi:hypothetical protein
MEIRMTLSECDNGRFDDPARGCRRSFGIDASGCENVIEALPARVHRIGGDFVRLARLHEVLLVLGPTPSVVDGIASCAILEEVEVSCGYRSAASLLSRMMGGAERAIGMKNAPNITNGSVSRNETVG